MNRGAVEDGKLNVSADCVMRSIDFAAVEELRRAGAWQQAGQLLAGEQTDALQDGTARFPATS